MICCETHVMCTVTRCTAHVTHITCVSGWYLLQVVAATGTSETAQSGRAALESALSGARQELEQLQATHARMEREYWVRWLDTLCGGVQCHAQLVPATDLIVSKRRLVHGNLFCMSAHKRVGQCQTYVMCSAWACSGAARGV